MLSKGDLIVPSDIFEAAHARPSIIIENAKVWRIFLNLTQHLFSINILKVLTHGIV
jgi:hypothetical protein